MIAILYHKLGLFNQEVVAEINFNPKSFAQKNSGKLFKEGVFLGDEQGIMMDKLDDGSIINDTSINLTNMTDLNIAGAGFKLPAEEEVKELGEIFD